MPLPISHSSVVPWPFTRSPKIVSLFCHKTIRMYENVSAVKRALHYIVAQMPCVAIYDGIRFLILCNVVEDID